jgi:hypothetical protein
MLIILGFNVKIQIKCTLAYSDVKNSCIRHTYASLNTLMNNHESTAYTFRKLIVYKTLVNL